MSEKKIIKKGYVPPKLPQKPSQPDKADAGYVPPSSPQRPPSSPPQKPPAKK